MTDTVIDRLIEEIERSYAELTQQLSDPEVLADRSRYTAIARRHAELTEAHALALQYREAERAAAEADEMLAAGDEPRRRDARLPAAGAPRQPPAGSTSSARRSACRCSHATPTTPRT